MASQLRNEIKALLERKNFEGIVSLSAKKRNLFRHLVAMTYDKDDVLSWRAIEATGTVTARMPPDEGRNIIQKVLWMLREESGNNAWSGPEILGEILRANPQPFLDVIPVLVSFHEEEFFRAGVLWAMCRIAKRWPELIEPFSGVAMEHVGSSNPSVKGYAALLLRLLGKPVPESYSVSGNGTVHYYEDGELTSMPLAKLPGTVSAPTGPGSPPNTLNS